jgi:hypothetical protein
MVASLILDNLQNRGGEPRIRFWGFHGTFTPAWGESAPVLLNSLG